MAKDKFSGQGETTLFDFNCYIDSCKLQNFPS
jgi:hypothetical protein